MAKTEILKEGSRKHSGGEFHIDTPATTNARPSYVIRWCGGTVSWWPAAKRRRWHDAISETGAH